MKFDIPPSVSEKLRDKHKVEPKEVYQCFLNRTHGFLNDTREEHKSDPITQWFIAETDQGRQLKICFLLKGGVVTIKTAYEPTTDASIKLYYKIAKEC